MDGGDFWHVARRNEATHRALRFRPIAPKPVVGGASSVGVSPEKAAEISTSKRVKRKYVRVRKDGNNPRRKREDRRSDGGGLNPVTEEIQLTAEKSDGRDSPEVRRSPTGEVVVESWVTVEHVTDTCMESVVSGLGCTDAERLKNLEMDTCPGFVSDGSMSKVEWVNEAYRSMVAAGHSGGGRSPENVVRLVTSSGDNGTHCQLAGCTDDVLFFTCRVRVQYYSGENNNKNNHNNKEKMCWKVMPCDVWRLDCGGFAWKLDIKAALSLGF